MSDIAQTLVTLGALILVGLLTDFLGRRTPLPRVTLLLIFGFLVGPSGLDLLPTLSEQWFPLCASLALVMVGFLLGEAVAFASLRKHGRLVLWISIGEVAGTAAVMFIGLIFLGVPAEIALLIAGIAPATDPAATTDVIHESKAAGPFTGVLLGVVAIDDAWGLILFSFLLAATQALTGQSGGGDILLSVGWEIGGALLLGVGLGIPMAYLTGRIKRGEPTLTEALGLVFLCGGIAMWLEVSFLLAAMVMGAAVANLARHHTRPFHAIEGIEWPFMILFFVLAGASLHVGALVKVGLVGVAYVLLRILGRLVGAWVGGAMCHVDAKYRWWMGFSLMPQAGVALGMALVATQRFPALAETLLPVVIGATVFFEVIGPVLTRLALRRMGEIGTKQA